MKAKKWAEYKAALKLLNGLASLDQLADQTLVFAGALFGRDTIDEIKADMKAAQVVSEADPAQIEIQAPAAAEPVAEPAAS